MHSLGEAQLALELWESACDAGVVVACTRGGDAYAKPFAPYRDDVRALALRAWGCDLPEPDPRSCFHAAEAVAPMKRPRREGRPDLYFRRMDRACALGSRRACGSLAWSFQKGMKGMPKDAALAQYYGAPRAPGADDGTFASVLARKAAFEEELVSAAFERRVSQVVGPPVQRQRNIEWRQRFAKFMEECSRVRDPSLCREELMRGGSSLRVGGSMRPGGWSAAEEPSRIPRDGVSPECARCLDVCPDVDLRSQQRRSNGACLCTCLQDRGGCGITAEALNLCLAAHAPRAAVRP
jgi:hypothetical protein